MIHPELIDRIERSLLRRQKGDVRPHLLRYSSRARNAAEFVAMAARLLTDTRQRQRWMTSWAYRLRVENSHSTPSIRSEVPSFQATEPAEFSASQLQNMREAVSQDVGPIAMPHSRLKDVFIY